MRRRSTLLTGVWLLMSVALACSEEKNEGTGLSSSEESSESDSLDDTARSTRGSSSVDLPVPDGGTTLELTDAAAPLAAMQALLDEVVQADLVELDALGLGVTIEFPDGRVYESAAGKTGPDPDAPSYEVHGTRQVIGSVTKLYTAVMVMQLVEAGQIDLDQTLDAWFPFDSAESISVRMLLQHTSGLADCLNQLTEEQYAQPWTPSELVELALEAEPLSEPGSDQAFYSNTNFALLAMLVEAETGKTWQDNLAARIAAPLGLHQTFYAGDAAGARDLVDGWMRTEDGWVGTLQAVDASIGWGYGAITTTNKELARFVKGLFGGELFSKPATLAQMLDFSAPMAASVLSPGEPPQTVGLGVIRYELGDLHLQGHLGHIVGYNAAVLRDAETGVLLTGTTNADGAIVALTLVKIAQALRDL